MKGCVLVVHNYLVNQVKMKQEKPFPFSGHLHSYILWRRWHKKSRMMRHWQKHRSFVLLFSVRFFPTNYLFFFWFFLCLSFCSNPVLGWWPFTSANLFCMCGSWQDFRQKRLLKVTDVDERINIHSHRQTDRQVDIYGK